ncbi:MAG: hydroxyacid dehydrogenase [Bacteroidales bacterium]|nr:hydroxyacid dehydrogenase [Bacteroidales bacterium]
MIITCVEPLGISENHFKELQKNFAGQGHSFHYFMDRHEDEATLAERMKESEIVIISNIKLTSTVLAQCSKLKMLSVAFTGLDHIDLKYCDEHNIFVQNAAGYSTTAVSELAVGLMIDVLRKITELDGTIRQGGSRGTFLGRELKGKTVGIVGTGAIGIATMRLLKAFGCTLLAYSRTERDEVKNIGAEYCDLNTLMQCSDIVSLHVPMTAETHHLVGEKEMALMKPTAILINTARGNVIDINALANALNNGKLAGAGIDVYEKEPPLEANHQLLNANNCVTVPHIGYATREAFDIRADIVINHVWDFINRL